ncbi:MAG: hypothetical protein PHX14_11245 [Syntrophomonadaceae bacterium]|nr:hypothetical protein [Syntrophomonadaceae bacterium]
MREITGSAWQRRGSSLIWDRELLGPLLRENRLIPLHQALNWLHEPLPVNPPTTGGKTIVVVGLQPVLESLEPEQSFNFLRHRLQRLILKVQDGYGGGVGLVLGLNCNWKQWRVDSSEKAYLTLRPGREIEITPALWNGVASEAQMIMVASTPESRARDNVSRVGGLHVPHFS